MNVQVLETVQIRPCTTPFTEDHTLTLSPRQRPLPRRHLPLLPCLHQHKHHHRSRPFPGHLHHYYPLSGSLRRASNGRYEVLCQVDQSLPLVNASVDCTLESLNYLDDPDMNSVEHLVPDPTPEDTLVNPCTLQLTVFKCGGFALGAAIHNALCDGLGATQFFCMAADLARGVNQMKFQPVWDRATLLGPRNPPKVEAQFLA